MSHHIKKQNAVLYAVDFLKEIFDLFARGVVKF